MATSSETVSETAAIPAREKAQGEGYFTYVEGVGSIPRDIYKYVKSDPLGDLPRYSVHIVIQHLLIFITFMFLVTTGLPIYFSDVFWAPVAISLFVTRTVNRPDCSSPGRAITIYIPGT